LTLVLASVGLGAPLDPSSIVTIQSARLEAPLTAGQRSTLVVSARIAAEWHINSDRPTGNYYIPTRLEVTPPAHVGVGAIAYPAARTIRLAFAGADTLSVFSGTVQFKIPLIADADFRHDIGAPAKIELRFQACNDSQCLRPKSISTTIDLAVASTDAHSAA